MLPLFRLAGKKLGHQVNKLEKVRQNKPKTANILTDKNWKIEK